MKGRMKDPKKAFIRIVDANFNRAKEALRVIEDVSRFILNNRNLTSQLKQLRHNLTQIILKFPISYKQLLLARDSAEDVGKDQWIKDKHSKLAASDILISNMKRAQEAVRVLEEMAKIVSPKQSPLFQKLRFELYEIEKRYFSKF
jgi:hypothetical protein